MNSFTQIIQKTVATSNEMYNYKHESSVQSSYDYAKIAAEYEYKHTLHNTTINILFKILVNIFAASQNICTIKTKFDYLKTILDNTLLDESIKEQFLLLFCKTQKNYYALCRLAHIYKYRRAPLRMQTDLFLNPIISAQSNVIAIVQNGQKYLFTVTDLQRIINTSLSNSPNFFSCPLAIKNPYNNMPFDKSTLYNIYFFIAQHKYVISPLFHAYFLSNFNLTVFRDENEALIRKEYIDNFVSSKNIDILHINIKHMLKNKRKINISADFPKEKLVEIMRPYLRMYINSVYSLDLSTRFKARDELEYHMKRFVKYNKQFGRKIITKTKNIVSGKIENPIKFNDKHLNIKLLAYKKHYTTSHLEVIEEHNVVSESDSDSDSESADE